MNQNKLKEIIGGNKEFNNLLKTRESLRKQEGNARKHLAEAEAKKKALTEELRKVRGEMKNAILKGNDPEALHQEEIRLTASLQSVERWVTEISDDILPDLETQANPIEEDLKRDLHTIVARYRRSQEEIFNRRLDDLGAEIIAIENAIRDVGREMNVPVTRDNMMYLESKEIMNRIRPF